MRLDPDAIERAAIRKPRCDHLEVSDAAARAAFAPYCERFGIEMGAAG